MKTKLASIIFISLISLGCENLTTEALREENRSLRERITALENQREEPSVQIKRIEADLEKDRQLFVERMIKSGLLQKVTPHNNGVAITWERK